MGATVLRAARRRPYVFPAALATLCAIAMWVTADAEHLPVRDPDGMGGPPIVRVTAILLVFALLDLLPRAIARGRGRPRATLAALRVVAAERWNRRRVGLVLVGLFSFYVTYVAYRNFKGFLPFLRPERHDAGLMSLDREIFGGHDPATVLHNLLGTGIAAQVLSVVYVVYLLFVPVSLAAALVWFGRDARRGLWYASALCVNWVLGAISYYALPSMGPAFVEPRLFADLPATASSELQHTLWVERLTVVFNSAGEQARDVVQSIAAFASLHVSVVLTAALMATLVKARRSVQVALWTYLVLVVIATIYLGWHYVSDDVAGAVIGLLSVGIGAVATGHGLGMRRPRPAQAHPPRVRTLNAPNVLSCARIAIAPLVAVAMLRHPEGSTTAAVFFAVAALTDLADGQIARRRGLITPLGKLLDPIADKLLVVCALASLLAAGRLAGWVVGVIVAREIVVTLVRMHAARRGVVVAAGLAGKVKMNLQVAMVLALMVVQDPAAAWVEVLVAATVTLTLVSGFGYARSAWRAGEGERVMHARTA